MYRLLYFFLGKKYYLPKIILAVILFFSIAHLTVDYFEQPLAVMAELFLLFYLFFLKFSSFLLDFYFRLDAELSKKRKGLFLFSAFVVGCIVSFFYTNMPLSYHQLRISTDISEKSELEILEIKVGVYPLDLNAFLVSDGWRVEDGHLYASGNASPLTLTFRGLVGIPVEILVSNVSDSKVNVVLDGKQKRINFNEIGGETKISLYTRYRNIPNIVFVGFLHISSAVLWGVLLFSALLLQEKGSVELDSNQGFDWRQHKRNLLILIGLSTVIHLVNMFATPLVVGNEDAPSYLDGAISLLEHGSIRYAPTVRGPAWIFFFTPIFFVFGRNPWGTKIVLHLIAIVAVPLAYRLGWQLSQNKKVASFSGVIMLLTPDLILYANYVWSDLINLVFGVLFVTFLVTAIRQKTLLAMSIVMLIGAVASMFRLENILLILIGAVFLFIEYIKQFREDISNKKRKKMYRKTAILSFLFVLSVLPYISWSVFKQEFSLHQGVHDYTGEVIYTGWVYYGAASNNPFPMPKSAAVIKIDEATKAYPPRTTDKKGIPTGWDIHASLVEYGYTPDEAIGILGDATWEYLLHDLSTTNRVGSVKIWKSLVPELSYRPTLPLPDEPSLSDGVYFNAEKISIPLLIKVQRKINQFLEIFYSDIYKSFVYFMVVALVLSLYQKPTTIWLPVLFVILVRFFVANIMSLSGWRYTLASLGPWIVVTAVFVGNILRGIRKVSKT